MSKILLVTPERCTGCRTCEIVCSLKNEGVVNPARSRITVIKDVFEGYEFPLVCMQCEDPICMAVCPVNAIYVNEETGAKEIDYSKCMGCRTCVISCPLGGALVDPVTGRTLKCHLCHGDPACAKYCKTKALEWVDVSLANQRKRRASVEKYTEVVKKAERLR